MNAEFFSLSIGPGEKFSIFQRDFGTFPYLANFCSPNASNFGFEISLLKKWCIVGFEPGTLGSRGCYSTTELRGYMTYRYIGVTIYIYRYYNGMTSICIVMGF